MDLPLLSLIIFTPLLGAMFILLFVKGDNEEYLANNAKSTALWTSLFNLFLSAIVLFLFNYDLEGYQFVEKAKWFDDINSSYHLGVDGMALSLVLLTTLLVPICILASWRSVKERMKEYMVAFLLLESFVIGVFCSLDLVLFYLFFEAVLIPMYLIIGIWGGLNRVYAAVKFFLYTLLGSVLLLASILYLYSQFGTTDIPALAELAPELPLNVSIWLWLGLFASFAVKVPMFPFHTWLPDAHVQAPTAGSVILAGVLLKMGAYGFLRFSLPFFPEASLYFSDFMLALSAIAVIYASLIAYRQTDIKKLIAYSSVAHMGFVTMGIFSFNDEGLNGAIFQMISHGLVSGALFLGIGVIYDRMKTREMDFYGGLVEKMPKYAVIMMLFTMASVGLPATSGFVGEFLSLLGAYKVNQIYAILAGTGLVLGAMYMLHMYRQVIFGVLKNPKLKNISDVSTREIICFTPLVVAVLLLGIYPSLLTDLINQSVTSLTSIYLK